MMNTEIKLDYFVLCRHMKYRWYLRHKVLGKCRVVNINRYDIGTAYIQFGKHQPVKCSLIFLELMKPDFDLLTH